MPLKKTLADLAAETRLRGVTEIDADELVEAQAHTDNLLIMGLLKN